jgi:hypothetical protein
MDNRNRIISNVNDVKPITGIGCAAATDRASTVKAFVSAPP